MKWHYIDNKSNRCGPISEAEFFKLLENKTITKETFVWNGKSVKDWTRIMAIEGLEEMLSITVNEHSHSASSSIKSKKKLAVGDQLMVLDTTLNLEPAKIIEVKDDKIKIHYTNWNSVWDEYLSSTDPRIKQIIVKPLRKTRQRKYSRGKSRSRGHSLSLKLIPDTSNESLDQKKDGKSVQSKIKIPSGTKGGIQKLTSPKIEETSEYKTDQDEMEVVKPSQYKKQAQQEAEKLVQERLKIEKERNTFCNIKEELQCSISERRSVDVTKLMESMEKFRWEHMRLESEHNERAKEITSLKETLKETEQNDETKNEEHEKMNRQFTKLEKMFKKQEANLLQREDAINLRAKQVEAYQIDSGRRKRVKRAILNAEKSIEALEDHHSKNIGKALAVQKYNSQALDDLKDMKKKMRSERVKLKKDHDRVIAKLSKISMASNQIREATHLLEEEKSNNDMWGEELKKLEEANAARDKENMAAFQKARKRLNAKMANVEKWKKTIEQENQDLKSLTKNQIAKLKDKFKVAHLDLNRKSEAIRDRQEALIQEETKLALREKQLNEDLNNAEQQRNELLKSTKSDQQIMVDQLGKRVDDLQVQLSELKNEKEKLSGPCAIAQDELVIQKNKAAKVKQELEKEKIECSRLSEELSECKSSMKSMKEQALKHKVESQVWEGITDRINSERLTLHSEWRELQKQARDLRKQLQTDKKKLQTWQETNIAVTIYEHNRRVSRVPSSQLRPGVPEDGALDDECNAGKASSFDQLLRSIMDSHESIVRNESKLKKRMEKCIDDLEIDYDGVQDSSTEEYDEDSSHDYEGFEEENDRVSARHSIFEKQESSEFFQDL